MVDAEDREVLGQLAVLVAAGAAAVMTLGLSFGLAIRLFELAKG